MNRWIKTLFFLLLPVGVFAHTLLVNVFDNGDDTMTVVGEFSTGESAAGALMRLEALASGVVLFEQRLPDASELSVPIPVEAYKIILDGGPGHQASMQGIPPKGGFIEAPKQDTSAKPVSSQGQRQTSQAGLLLAGLAFLLLFATMIVSYKNTNKLLRELKH